jgi:hypothetical protein
MGELAMSKNVVGSMSDWSGMLKDLFRQIDDGSINKGHLCALLDHRNPFEVNVQTVLVDWQKFYKDVFGIGVGLSGLEVPSHQHGFDRLIVVAKGMTSQGLYDKCGEMFPCWKWTDQNLDEIVLSERTSKNESYAVWVRDRAEADEENKTLSANRLKGQGILGITLEERLLYELMFFREANGHLDKANWTLCSGSRCSVSHVPSVNWVVDKF